MSLCQYLSGIGDGLVDSLNEAQYAVVSDGEELQLFADLIRAVGQVLNNLWRDRGELFVLEFLDDGVEQVSRFVHLLVQCLAVNLVHLVQQLVAGGEDMFPLGVALDHITQRSLSSRRTTLEALVVGSLQTVTNLFQAGVIVGLRRELIVFVGDQFRQQRAVRNQRFVHNTRCVIHRCLQHRQVVGVGGGHAFWNPGCHWSGVHVAVLVHNVADKGTGFWRQLDGGGKWVGDTDEAFEVINHLWERPLEQPRQITGGECLQCNHVFRVTETISRHGGRSGRMASECKRHKNTHPRNHLKATTPRENLLMELRPAFEAAPVVKALINIGALLDVPTGTFLEGRLGQYILNGGLGALTGIVGIGNNFKSTLMHFQFLTAMSRMRGSIGNTYDTEVNIQEWHLLEMINRIEEFGGEDILTNARWVITDKTVLSGNKWWDALKEWLEAKLKNSSKLSVSTPFWNRGRQGPLMILQPTFTEVDSFTEFETDDVTAMQDVELGDSKGNTIHMRQGLAKLRLLMEAPRLAGGGYNYTLMTAHIGKESTMQQAGGGQQVPIQKLKHLKNGDKIKGTTDKFTFVTHNCWHAFNAAPLINDGTKGPEYPRNSDDNLKLDTDLNIVHIRNLRAKSGPTGMTLQLIVSQTEGVLPSLTEFHHIRNNARYGMVKPGGSSYDIALYPDCSLQRTTVRGKIDNDARLRRALNITSEMCQMDYMWHHLDEGIMCTPQELYDDLKAKGYDWNQLLDTRGWWTINDEEHPIPFLSTMDLLRMRAGLYHPYWLAEDKKTRVVGFHGTTKNDITLAKAA